MNIKYITAILFFSINLQAKAPKAWPEKIRSQLQNKNKIWSLCEGPQSYHVKMACAHFKNSSGPISLRNFTIDFQSANELLISNGKISTSIARTDDPLIFQVNHKLISLKEPKNLPALEEDIEKLMPNIAFRQSLWINQTFAMDSDSIVPAQEISQLIALILISTNDQEICDQTQTVVKMCPGYPKESQMTRPNITQTLLTIKNILSSPSMKSDREIDNLRRQLVILNGSLSIFLTEISQLSNFINRLDEKKQVLESCQPQNQWTELETCRRMIQELSQALITSQSKLTEPDKINETLSSLGNILGVSDSAQMKTDKKNPASKKGSAGSK